MNKHEGCRPVLPLEEITVGELIERTCGRHAESPAIWYDGQTWTYGQLRTDLREIAGAFASQGIRKGQQVAIWGDTEGETILTMYALQYIGAVVVMVNTMLGQEELDTVLGAVDPVMICTGISYKTDGNLGENIRFPDGMRQVTLGRSSLPGVPSMNEWRKALPADWEQTVDAMRQAVEPSDTAVILYTSGSTSAPKAVCSSHYSRANGGLQQAYDLHAGEKDKFCVSVPIFHCFCISANLMASMAVGACLCVPRDRHTGTILDCIETCGCTVLNSVPTMFHALIHKPQFSRERVKTLRTGIIGGASYPPEEFVEIEEAIGFTLMSSIGQTETTAGFTVCEMDDSLDVRSHTLGHFMSHVDGKVADPKTGEEVPSGEQGELCVRGYLVMQEYYHRPDLTGDTIDGDGYVHTGDLGRLDGDGNITLVGRLRELIIRGGENISPNEIETSIALLKKTDGCKAVGVPDSHYGEEICLCLQRKPGTELTEDDVREFLEARLACYKVPKYILFWDELPRTASGKISGKLCAAKAREELKGRLT